MKTLQPQVDQTPTGSQPRSTQAVFGSTDNPLRRSFLMQLSAGCEVAGGDLRGRVQQIATSDGGNFESVDALLAILRRIFTEEQQLQNCTEDFKEGGENE